MCGRGPSPPAGKAAGVGCFGRDWWPLVNSRVGGAGFWVFRLGVANGEQQCGRQSECIRAAGQRVVPGAEVGPEWRGVVPWDCGPSGFGGGVDGTGTARRRGGRGLGWVGPRPHPDPRDHGHRPSLRVTTGPAGSRLSGLKAYRTDDRPRTPRWHTQEGDAAVPVCVGRACCLGKCAAWCSRPRWGGWRSLTLSPPGELSAWTRHLQVY